MRLDQEIKQHPVPGHSKNNRSERCFDLSLPAMITGVNALGKEFEEQTELSSISSEEAILVLKNRVMIGTPLTLSLNVPKTLILENQLNLIVTGEVVFATSDPSQKGKQLISVRLDKLYKIQPIFTSR
jgi:hypothetical protein